MNYNPSAGQVPVIGTRRSGQQRRSRSTFRPSAHRQHLSARTHSRARSEPDRRHQPHRPQQMELAVYDANSRRASSCNTPAYCRTRFSVRCRRPRISTPTFCITYLVRPGTAIYVGYNSNLQNLDRRPDPHSHRAADIARRYINDGRQFFVKARICSGFEAHRLVIRSSSAPSQEESDVPATHTGPRAPSQALLGRGFPPRPNTTIALYKSGFL